jgi:hypothetical protein
MSFIINDGRTGGPDRSEETVISSVIRLSSSSSTPRKSSTTTTAAAAAAASLSIRFGACWACSARRDCPAPEIPPRRDYNRTHPPTHARTLQCKPPDVQPHAHTRCENFGGAVCAPPQYSTCISVQMHRSPLPAENLGRICRVRCVRCVRGGAHQQADGRCRVRTRRVLYVCLSCLPSQRSCRCHYVLYGCCRPAPAAVPFPISH